MTADRLSDEVVRWHADALWRARQARPDLTADAYNAELDALAAEVLEWRNRRCETCAAWTPYDGKLWGMCRTWGYDEREATWSCPHWESRP